jgi:excinuclease UvrABC nuclease subunit
LYRYLDIDDVVIYIGIGKLRDRFMSDARTADWGIHTIEYSIVEDESDRKNLEAKATKMYEDKYGCLPKYNRKHGG